LTLFSATFFRHIFPPQARELRHHQRIERMGKLLEVTATTKDQTSIIY
jgi:gamma-glutamyl-gamma-aminobutyrate hydrolase PuuD